MSYQAVEEVMKRSRATGSERMLLMVIATHADADTLTAYLGETTLCAEANMKERNLRYTLAKLKASGELQCIVGGGRGRANVYTLTLPEPASQSDKKGQSTAPLSDEKGQQAAGFTEVKRGNPSPKRGQSVAEKGQPAAPQPLEPERTGEGDEPRARDPRGFPFDHPAVEMYVAEMKPDPGLSIELAQKIAVEVTDVPTWREVLVVFTGNGYRGRDGTGRNVGNVIHRYWTECKRKATEAQSNGKRTEPRTSKPTREETYNGYDYSPLDGDAGEGAGRPDSEVPADEWMAAPTAGRSTGDDRRLVRSSRH